MSARKFPKLVQVDNRGVIVIPKDVRAALGIEEGTGVWVYAVENEGIYLHVEREPPVEEVIAPLKKNKSKLNLKSSSTTKVEKTYKKKTKGNLEVL